MEPDGIKFHSQFLIHIHRARWIIVSFLLLTTLAGCLTSHAAGPSEPEQEALPVAGLPLATSMPPTSTPTMPPTPAITTVPNMAVRALQTTTPTATATVTPTAVLPTDTPTATPTSEPTITPEPTATATPTPTDTPAPTAIRATVAPFQAYAWVDNYFPAPGSVVTVHGRLFKNGRPVNGAHMGVTWRYTHGQGYCDAYTGIDGRASCAQNIGAPLQNYWVFVDVVFVHEDELFYAKTGFLTDP
jgi:hypothetical protein